MSSIKKRSPLWKYFDIKSDDQKFAICLLCNVNISRGGEGKKAGTTAMKNHLKTKHPDEFSTLNMNTNFTNAVPTTLANLRQNRLLPVNAEKALFVDDNLVEASPYEETVDNSDFDPNRNQQHHFNSNNSTLTESTSSDSPYATKRRKRSSESAEADTQIKEMFLMLKGVVEQLQPKEEDDCDLYGKLLATKLRKLNDAGRHLLMHRIDEMVIDALVMALNTSEQT